MYEKILSKINQTKLRQVAERYQLELIVLFGSRAKGKARWDSDLDIAVRTFRPDFGRREAFFESDWEMNLLAGLSEAINLPYDIDLVFLNTVSSTLMFEVARYGILIYEKEPTTFLHFRSYAARRFDDDAKFRQLGWEYLKRWCLDDKRDVRPNSQEIENDDKLLGRIEAKSSGNKNRIPERRNHHARLH